MSLISMFTCLTCVAAAAGSDAPTVDGFVTDEYWSLHARVWTLRDPRLPHNVAQCYLGFDADYLYFAADVTDRNVFGSERRRQKDVNKDDSVRFFIDFGDGTARSRTPKTFEYAVSAAGGANWTRGIGDGAGDNYPEREDPASWQTKAEWSVGIHPGSTLNVSSGRDTGYGIEIRIPWAELEQRWPLPPDRTIGICFVNACRPESASVENVVLSNLPNITLENCHNPSLWQRIAPIWQAPLRIRGVLEPLPVCFGSSGDEPWHAYESTEKDADGPWLNRNAWTARLDDLQRSQFNTLLLEHPHPYAGLIPLKQYPGANCFDAEELARHMDHFRWLLAEVADRRMHVYLVLPDACERPAWAQGEGTDPQGLHPEAYRAYLREATADLLRAYPELSGMVVCPGGRRPSCFELVRDGFAAGFHDVAGSRAGSEAAGASPELILYTRNLEPAEARQIVETYPRTRLMHDLQDLQWFKPMVDPRLGWYAAATMAASPKTTLTLPATLAVGGPRNALDSMLWADPVWMRTLALDLRRRGTGGIMFTPQCAEPWLAAEALGAYATGPGEQFNPRRWEARLQEIYGIGDHAGQLLETLQHASAIVPRFVSLVHDRSERYMPQYGLPLSHYLEMPTMSSYGVALEQADEIEWAAGPGEVLTEINPDWGEEIATIRQQVSNDAPLGATRPQAIADELGRHVLTCRSRLHSLRHVDVVDAEQAARFRSLLDQIELSAALGEHFQKKIEAAIGYELFWARRGRSVDCTRSLQQSVDAWEDVVEVTERLYPEPRTYWQSQIVSVPPWTPEQLRDSYVRVTGHWRDQLPRFEQELNLVRQAISMRDREVGPPLWDHISAEPATNLEKIEQLGFESGLLEDARFKLHGGAKLTKDPETVIAESWSLLADTRELDDDRHVVLTTVPESFPLAGHRPYLIMLVYRVIDRGGDHAVRFEAGVRSATEDQAFGAHRVWGAPDGYQGSRILRIPALPDDNNQFYIAVHGRAAVVIDQIRVHILKVY